MLREWRKPMLRHVNQNVAADTAVVAIASRLAASNVVGLLREVAIRASAGALHFELPSLAAIA